MPCAVASSAGATPTTVKGDPLMTNARPSTDGSPLNSESHVPLPMTATGLVSDGSNPRPRTGLNPIVSK